MEHSDHTPGAHLPVAAAALTEIDFAIDLLEAASRGLRVGAIGGDRQEVLRAHHAAVAAPSAEARLGVPGLQLIVG